MKDKKGFPLFRKDQVVKRWEFFNECRDHDDLTQYPLVEGPVGKITVTGVHQQLKLIKQNEAVGTDGIPIESLRPLDDFGIDILVDMLISFLTSEVIPDEWRQSTITPIYKK